MAPLHPPTRLGAANSSSPFQRKAPGCADPNHSSSHAPRRSCREVSQSITPCLYKSSSNMHLLSPRSCQHLLKGSCSLTHTSSQTDSSLIRADGHPGVLRSAAKHTKGDSPMDTGRWASWEQHLLSPHTQDPMLYSPTGLHKVP